MATVADLIESWCAAVAGRPADFADLIPESDAATAQRAAEGRAESAVAEALRHYGPVRWGRRVLAASVPARTSGVFVLDVQDAQALAWPPAAGVEPKVAGFVSVLTW